MEPRYDEDIVNLGYLKKTIDNSEKNIKKQVNKTYGSKPNPPYYKGDTWVEQNTVYTCINTRGIGTYDENDWVSESGAKEEAQSKNKTFLTKPSKYNVGDMWILQTDNDHKAGKRGEILVAITGRVKYNKSDWVNQLSYGSISSINEVSEGLNNAINRIGNVEGAIKDGIIITFYQDTVPEAKHIGDLWYVTDMLEGYTKGKLYRYDGNDWSILDDPEITQAFEKANEATLIADGKIQSFYSDEEPTEDVGVGDLWINTAEQNKLHRYNGTNWIEVYDTRIDDVITGIDTITKRNVQITTDLGQITQRVSETETKLNNDYLTTEQINAENQTIKEDIDFIKKQQTTVETTAQGLQIQIDQINNEGVKTVKNTTVDINENGVSVGKSDSEFSTTMNNTGTYMYAYGKQIAKYDKDGAETANFKATGEVEVGYLKILKGETNGERRTHIHCLKGG